MKKILIGLLALSATAMATTTSTGGETQSVDINTKVNIVNSGIIITGEDSGALTAIKSVELDHGTLLQGGEGSNVSRTIYVRRTNNSVFPTGSTLEMSLVGDNQLKNAANQTTNTITHTLIAEMTGIVSSASSTPAKLTAESTSNSQEFVTTENTSAIGINLSSSIDSAAIATVVDLIDGEYKNTSTLSVKFSKIPENKTSSSVTPLAQESGR